MIYMIVKIFFTIFFTLGGVQSQVGISPVIFFTVTMHVQLLSISAVSNNIDSVYLYGSNNYAK